MHGANALVLFVWKLIVRGAIDIVDSLGVVDHCIITFEFRIFPAHLSVPTEHQQNYSYP